MDSVIIEAVASLKFIYLENIPFNPACIFLAQKVGFSCNLLCKIQYCMSAHLAVSAFLTRNPTPVKLQQHYQ